MPENYIWTASVYVYEMKLLVTFQNLEEWDI